jgi:hypothetical protein
MVCRAPAPVLALLLALAFAVPAAAQAPPPVVGQPPVISQPPAAQSFDRALKLTFGLRAEPGSRVRYGVSVARLTDGTGLLLAENLYLAHDAAPSSGDAGLFVLTPGPASVLGRRPGRYYVQAIVQRPDGTVVVSDIVEFRITLPASWTKRGRIPRAIGRQGHRQRFAISSRGLPGEVGFDRLRSLLRTSARRWNLRAGGSTTRAPGVQDGRNVVGFSHDLAADTLGLQVDFRETRVRIRNGVRSVKTVTTEQDLLLNDSVPWQQGPEHPTPSEVDLETTIIHELGHFAGNKAHATRCNGISSPMIDAIGSGEFWRTPFDRWIDCQKATAAVANGAFPPPPKRVWRFAHVVVDRSG